MKKIIFFNILITIAAFPYGMSRWMWMPYFDTVLNVQFIMLFSFGLFGTVLAISNVLMLFSWKWKRSKLLFLKVTMVCLALMTIYPLYAGLVLADQGTAWVDVIVLWILYGNLWLSNRESQQLYL